MKRTLVMGLAIFLALPVLSTTVIYAETGSNSGSSTSSETETGDDTAGTSARVAQRKAELKTKLASAQKEHLVAKCTASQGVISSVKGKVNGIQTSRSEVYKNLVDRLNDLSAKLKAKSMDTTSLNADITTLQGKITTFNTDLTAFKQAVTDLKTMDCKADPDGFKASLDTARADLQKVVADSVAIKDYVNNTIKPLLKTIRDTVEKMDKGTSSTGGNQ